MHELSASVEAAYEGTDVQNINEILGRVYRLLEAGEIRVAENRAGEWTTNEWIKKAILLSFRQFPAQRYDDGISTYYDRIQPRFAGSSAEDFKTLGVRVTPGAVVRSGSYLGAETVLMPSFVNVGAYVGARTMVDTWATVGSCAQIGANVHLSGGVGIGGVLEPTQATPTIIEDDCFVGARSEVVEGVIVGHGSVIGMGVFIGQSTPIYDRDADEVMYGRVPPHSVVVSGSLPRDKYSLSAAIIVKKVDARTRSKTSITELLRGV